MTYHVGSKRDIQTRFATIHGFGNFYASSIAPFFLQRPHETDIQRAHETNMPETSHLG